MSLVRRSRTPSSAIFTQWVECHNHLQPSSTPQTAHAKPQGIITPVWAPCLQVFLHYLPCAEILASGFCDGFHIPHLSVGLSSSSHNHRSAFTHFSFLEDYISKRNWDKGQIVGPLFTQLRFSFSLPLGVIKKRTWAVFELFMTYHTPRAN